MLHWLNPQLPYQKPKETLGEFFDGSQRLKLGWQCRESWAVAPLDPVSFSSSAVAQWASSLEDGPRLLLIYRYHRSNGERADSASSLKWNKELSKKKKKKNCRTIWVEKATNTLSFFQHWQWSSQRTIYSPPPIVINEVGVAADNGEKTRIPALTTGSLLRCEACAG